MPRTCNLISLVLGRAGYRHQLDVNSCCAVCCWFSPGPGKQGGGFHLSGGTWCHLFSAAMPSPCMDSQNRSWLEARPWGPVACGCAEISPSPGVCCWAEAEVGLAPLRAGLTHGSSLAGGCQQGWGTAAMFPGTNSHARSPRVGLTMVPSTMVSEQPGRGWGMEPVVSAHSQSHRALWLVTSGQKIPQQRRKMFLAGSFPAGFHLEVTFLWQYSARGLTDTASCALTRCREGLGSCWPDGGTTWAVRSKPGWKCPTGWWQLQPHKGPATQQE